MNWLYPEAQEAIIAQLRRATLERLDDSGTQQIIKKMRGLASESPEDIFRAQTHGFSSHPPKGSEGLLLALGGRSDRMVALGFEHKDKRPKSLDEGGSALYDADGKIIKLVKEKNYWDAGGKPVEITNATTIEIKGQTDITIGLDGRWIRIRPGRVDLGIESKDEDAPYKVMTEGGPSAIVYARVD